MLMLTCVGNDGAVCVRGVGGGKKKRGRESKLARVLEMAKSFGSWAAL